MSQKSIAIIGSGITGLSLGYILSHPLNGYDVTIYECSHRLGMDSQSIKFVGKTYADGTFPSDTDHHDVGYNLIREPGTEENAGSAPFVRIDMPLRVFSESYYPHLTALYKTVNIPFRAENYQASFTHSDGSPILSYSNLLLGTLSLPYVAPSTLASSSIMREVIRYLACAPRDLENGRLTPPPGYVTSLNVTDLSSLELPSPTSSSNGQYHVETLLEYLVNEEYSDEFIYQFQLPTVSSIATCSLAAAAKMPAYIIVFYQSIRQGGGVRRVLGGANMVANTLAANCNVLCNRAVMSIELAPPSPSTSNNATYSYCDNDDGDDDDAAMPATRHTATPSSSQGHQSTTSASRRIIVHDSQGESRVYDKIVFATQANQTARILQQSLYGKKSGKDDDQRKDNPVDLSNIHPQWRDLMDLLGTIPYESSELVLHSDERFMPSNHDEWKSVNFIVTQTVDEMKNAVSDGLQASAEAPVASHLSSQDTCGLSAIATAAAEMSNDANSACADAAGNDDGRNTINTHDARLLAQKWAKSLQQSPSYNSTLSSISDAPYVGQDEPMSTIWMNQVQTGINPSFNLFQTWNPSKTIPIDEDLVYGRSFFQRPIVTEASVAACGRLWKHYQGIGGVYCVGSFSMGGVPLLESGVASSVAVAHLLKAENVLHYKTSDDSLYSPIIPAILPARITPVFQHILSYFQRYYRGSQQHTDQQQHTNQQRDRHTTKPSSSSSSVSTRETQVITWKQAPTLQNRLLSLILVIVYTILAFFACFPARSEKQKETRHASINSSTNTIKQKTA